MQKHLLLLSLLSLLPLACQKQQSSTEKSAEKSGEFPAARVAAIVPPNFCAPLGEPIAGGANLSGANAFALCQIGANPANTLL